MNCHQAEQLLPLYVGHDLDVQSTQSVLEHVQTCGACAGVLREFEDVSALTRQFASPLFSDNLYAGVRRGVLQEIGNQATAPWLPQLFANLFRPRLAWAVATVLLIALSLAAVYFITNPGNDRKELVAGPPPTVRGTIEPANSASPADKQAAASPAHELNRDLSGPEPRRKKQRPAIAKRLIDVADASSLKNASPPNRSLPQPALDDSAASEKTLRVEIQTADPNIRIIWFTQQESKPAVPSSKGT